MAEYLDPSDGYALVTLPDWQAPQPWWIEVPEGAEIYGVPPASEYAYFHKVLEDQNWYYSSITHNWSKSGHPIGAFDHIIWQRPAQPEELPFIDDEPPAHFVVRPKPRERVYAVLDDPVLMTPKEAFTSFSAQFGAFWRDLGAAAKKLRDEGEL